MRRRLVCAAVAAGLVPVGVFWRMAPLHLPQFAYKYGGSVLWAAMVYWIVAAVMPRGRVWVVGLVAAGVAAAVELSRLYHSPGLDAFRMTLAGKLILGRFFSVRNIVAYWMAIGVAALVDAEMARRTRLRGDFV